MIASKCCTRCQKPGTDFNLNKRAKDGLYSWCKSCRKEYDGARRAQNLEQCRARDRDRRLQNPESYRENRRARRLQNLEDYRASRRARYRRDLERSRAQSRAYRAVQRAIARGDLIKPDCCEACGGLGSEIAGGLEAHHYLGYAREHYLDVQWLCVPHHREADRMTSGVNITELHPAPVSM